MVPNGRDHHDFWSQTAHGTLYYWNKLLDLEEQTKKILSSDILEQKDAVVFCNIDDALHRTIADACKNKYLNMNLSQIYDQNIRIRILGEQPNNSFKGCCKTDK